MLQTVERECETLKESVWGLHNEGGAHGISRTQGLRPCTGGYAATQVGWEITIGVTVHDEMPNLRQKGAGSENLRHELRARFGAICCQESIDGPELGGTVRFEFKRCYKTPRANHETTLVHLSLSSSLEHKVLSTEQDLSPEVCEQPQKAQAR